MIFRRCFLAAILALTAIGAAPADSIVLRSTPIALNPDDPQSQRLGKLAWLGGLHITSADKRFGGYSALETAPGGRLVSVSDLGHWFVFRPVLDASGKLVGVSEGEIEPLRDDRGHPFSGKAMSDAESLRRDPIQGGFLVAFERHHRVLRYRTIGGPGIPIATPEEIKSQPDNGGIEAMAAFSDGRLLLISEQAQAENGDLKAWLRVGEEWHKLSYAMGGNFLPTDAAVTHASDLLVLERSFNFLTREVGARLVRVPAQRVAPGGRIHGETLAEWGKPYSVDNMEGLAVARGPGDSTLLWIISDDNQSRRQRTLLMLFRLE